MVMSKRQERSSYPATSTNCALREKCSVLCSAFCPGSVKLWPELNRCLRRLGVPTVTSRKHRWLLATHRDWRSHGNAP